MPVARSRAPGASTKLAEGRGTALNARIVACSGRVARVKDPALSASTKATDLPFDAPAKYWLSLRGYDPVATARALPQPLLILQGGRDYQVTEADDLPLWKKGLAGKANATFKVYPKLNHAYFAGEGVITPAEYGTLGHVDGQVIEDLAAFVAK